MLKPVEQAVPDRACVVYRVCAALSYPVSFEEVWGTGACDISWPGDVATACATEGALSTSPLGTWPTTTLLCPSGAYEGSAEINAFSSKHDYSFEGMAKLGKEERRGYALFRGKGQCHRRHTGSGQEALFTDFTFDNLGVPQDPENPASVAPACVDPVVTPYSGGFKPPLGTRPPIHSEACLLQPSRGCRWRCGQLQELPLATATTHMVQ